MASATLRRRVRSSAMQEASLRQLLTREIITDARWKQELALFTPPRAPSTLRRGETGGQDSPLHSGGEGLGVRQAILETTRRREVHFPNDRYADSDPRKRGL